MRNNMSAHVPRSNNHNYSNKTRRAVPGVVRACAARARGQAMRGPARKLSNDPGMGGAGLQCDNLNGEWRRQLFANPTNLKP